ncbi:ArsR/SmtB family transcription factor [Kitasatospora sp. NPDC056651]|uniref:ArsR/SmtB family transcription factor n=1 Tax=Kitasatospora sp. NPDC056651 TaxID=3345892 RepID=UPI00369A5653
MLEVAVIEEPAAAEASLDPMRSRLLAALTEPASAAMLAARLGLPRQKINYHLKELERHGLVELAEERRKGNVTERVYRSTAASYVISPSVLAAVSPDPARSPDQLSARWLLALGSRLVQEVGALLTGASRARRRIATFGIDAQVRFASAADRAAFAEELAQSVATLVSRYHDESAPGGRSHRVVVGLHQIPAAQAGPGTEEAGAETEAEAGAGAGTREAGARAGTREAGAAPDQEDPR